jgi:hypothetical protein
MYDVMGQAFRTHERSKKFIEISVGKLWEKKATLKTRAQAGE